MRRFLLLALSAGVGAFASCELEEDEVYLRRCQRDDDCVVADEEDPFVCDDGRCVPTRGFLDGNCGNGDTDGDEECDDGNDTDDDGCSNACVVN